VSFLAKSLEGGFVDEDIEVHGGADRLCSAAGGDGHAGVRGLPEDRDLGANVFSLEAQVRGARSIGAPSFEAT